MWRQQKKRKSKSKTKAVVLLPWQRGGKAGRSKTTETGLAGKVHISSASPLTILFNASRFDILQRLLSNEVTTLKINNKRQVSGQLFVKVFSLMLVIFPFLYI